METPRQEAQASSSSRTCDHGHGGGDRDCFDRPAELMSVDQYDSKLIGAPISVAGGVGGGAPMAEVKRKRGRPPRGGGQAKPRTPVVVAADEEEDVCFICFDGGSLVLCDRRNCPKAYHPACIKRDESFFRSRAKWNCGWHICSTCMKASHYLCYTCTYSLCKGCTKDADFVCVRDNKGFCGTCKRTILLIENFEGNKEGPQVDFDDKTSWEYLFKVYWVLLKGNLSLTLDELLKAKNPWTSPVVSASNWAGGLYGGIRDTITVSSNCCPDLEVLNAKRRKINTKTNVLVTANSLGIEKHGSDTPTHLNGSNWASKELLELVAHMRNGDTSVMSQFDVQNLVLDYIKRNNLRDPLQNSQIVCDLRLLSLFGQARLGHIEMLKLLEYHFLIKEDPPVNNSMGGLGVGSQTESSWGHDSQMTTVKDKRQKLRKRVDEKGLPSDPDAYARIDVHNINMICLRRCLLEILADNAENFHEKVVGSIVRIRVSSSGQKPDMHRLVRVVGTSKCINPYKIATKETNLMLDILNLDKKENLTIDRVSDQEFSQEECERLRQSIKFGLIKRLTVGEIHEKAIALQEVKVNDWLEAEILRLNHLRDRASEKGLQKEVRECVEKLERLNSPGERKRLLEEVPIIHSDPSMDPSYDFDRNPSEIHQNKQVTDYKAKQRNSGVVKKKRESTSAGKIKEKKSLRTNDFNALKHEVDSSDSGINQPVNDWETYKIWHYQDPTGKIQGPFFMVQLRKWSISGHFPPHLRIWRLNEKPEDSILLTDVLDGLCSNDQLSEVNINKPQKEQERNNVSDKNKNNANVSGENRSVNVTPVSSEKVERSVNLDLNDQSKNLDGSNEIVDTDGNAVAVVARGNCNNFLEDLFSLDGDYVLPTQPQVSNSQHAIVLPENKTQSPEVHKDRITERNSDQSENIWQNANSETRNDFGSENRSDGEDQSGQSSGQSWIPPISGQMKKGSNSPSKSLKTPEQNQTGIDFPALPGNTSNLSNSNESLEGQAEKSKKQSASSGVVPVHDNTGLSWSTASSLVAGSALLPEVAGSQAKPPIEEWDSSIVSVKISGDQTAATPASISDHLTPSSPSHPHSNTSSWHDMIPDPDEFSSLLNESVSDLLAEVEAMESLHALSCHAVVVNSGGDLTEASKTDCVTSSPVEGPGKGCDALSSTADVHLAPPPPLEAKRSTVEGCRQRSSSVSPETEVSVNQWEVTVEIPAALAAPASWNVVEIAETPWNPDWGAVQGNNTGANWEGVEWNRPVPVKPNGVTVSSVPPPPPPVAAPTPTPTPVVAPTQSPTPVVAPTPTPSPVAAPTPTPVVAPTPTLTPVLPPQGGILGSQPRHGSGERYSPRDRAYHGKDSGFGRNRHGWNNSSKQPYFGSGGSFRAPVKGQRVCKFYESGYCKRGSSCSFFHP